MKKKYIKYCNDQLTMTSATELFTGDTLINKKQASLDFTANCNFLTGPSRKNG